KRLLILTAPAIDSRPHPEVRAKRASMDGHTCGLAAILRGPRKARAPQDEVHSAPLVFARSPASGGLLPFAKLFDLLRFLLIDAREPIARTSLRFKQLVELGVNGLRVAVLAALNEQRHAPRREQRNAVPVQRIAVEYEP